MTDSTSGARPWLVIVDMQNAFGDPGSGWATEGYAEASSVIERLRPHFGDRVVFTRFVRDPAEKAGWSDYYRKWSDFRLDPSDTAWNLTIDPAGAPVINEPTFSKWTAGLRAVVGDADLAVCGVATECCVLSTVMAAADAGRRVQVVADACAGASQNLHRNALEIMDANAPLITVTQSSNLLAG